MSFIIAVDDSLNTIKEALNNQGYKTVDFSMADFRDIDAYVIDENNEDLVKRKNSIADERVIAAGNNDADTVISILNNHLAAYKNKNNQ